jgi:hypothetical protein
MRLAPHGRLVAPPQSASGMPSDYGADEEGQQDNIGE